MKTKVITLASGSSGNCFILVNNQGAILIDAGGKQLSFKRLKAKLAREDLELKDIKGILVTHVHGDHFGRAAVLACSKEKVPLFVENDRETWGIVRAGFGRRGGGAVSLRHKHMIRQFHLNRKFKVGGFYVKAFRVPHNMPCVGFSIYDGDDKKVTLVYDFNLPLQREMDRLIYNLADSELLIVESNYDNGLIIASSIDTTNDSNHIENARINHMSNFDTAKLVLNVIDAGWGNPRKVILAHVSKKHNRRSLAKSIIQDGIRRAGTRILVYVAPRLEDNRPLRLSI